jgi:hypothetical protein
MHLGRRMRQVAAWLSGVLGIWRLPLVPKSRARHEILIEEAAARNLRLWGRLPFRKGAKGC